MVWEIVRVVPALLEEITSLAIHCRPTVMNRFLLITVPTS